MSTSYNQLDAIMAYETGTLGVRKTLDLFVDLVNSGLAWRLQGHYGRTAKAMIDEGLLYQKQNGEWDADYTRICDEEGE